MTNNELQDAQRSFGNLREAIYQLESTFQKLFAGLAEIDHRLETLERNTERPIMTHIGGSQGTLPPGFDMGHNFD